MPNIVLNLTREQVIELYAVIGIMAQGEGNSKEMRGGVRLLIHEVWPETRPHDATETAPGLTRPMQLNPKQQRAIADGLLALANAPTTSDDQYDTVKRIATEICRFNWKWFQKFLCQRELEDFDGEFIAEPALNEDPPNDPPIAVEALPKNAHPDPIAQPAIEAEAGPVS